MLFTDVRNACRSLWHARSFTTIAVVTLALGIGVTTAIFSVVNAVLLRPLPYANPQRLVWIATTMPALSAEIVGGADYLAWRDEARTIRSVAAYDDHVPLTQLTAGEPERIMGARVSASFLPTLGIAIAAGRQFTGGDAQLNAPPVAIVSAGLWERLRDASGERATAADRSPAGRHAFVAGQVLRLDAGSVEIVGVLPAAFVFPGVPTVDVLLPLRLDEATERSRTQMSLLRTIGRLQDGAGLDQAREELTAIRRRSEQAALQAAGTAGPAGPPAAAGPRPRGVGGSGGQIQIRRGPGPGPGPGPRAVDSTVVVRTLQGHLVGDVKPALMLLAATVVLVLLIACANVANLLLGRAASRARELAVRAAIGASRWQVVRQLLVESVVLSLAGGAAAVLVAYWTLLALVSRLPPDLAGGALRDAAPHLDVTLLAVALIVSAATAFVFGVLPALAASNVDVTAALRTSGHGVAGGLGRSRLRRVLVAGEIAIAIVLLVGAGLLVRSFARLLAVDPGFRAERVLTMAVDLRQHQQDGEARGARNEAFFEQLGERVRSLPGVVSVAWGDTVPLRQYTMIMRGLRVEGHEPTDDGPPPDVAITAVSASYFATMGMRVVRGRPFTDQDRAGAPEVAIVSESMARQFWGTDDPVGKRIQLGPSGPDWITVVGVAADVRQEGLTAPARRAMFRPFAQSPLPFGFLAVRTAMPPDTMVQAVRAEVRRLDPTQALYDVATMDQRLDRSVAARRFGMLLVTGFAALALALAAIGLYGVLAHAVTERTREIGVRMALGADAGDVVRLVVRQAAAMVGAGAILGIAAALAAGPLIASTLYSVTPRDPATLVGVPVLLALVALTATWWPARRAVRVDPVVALRDE